MKKIAILLTVLMMLLPMGGAGAADLEVAEDAASAIADIPELPAETPEILPEFVAAEEVPIPEEEVSEEKIPDEEFSEEIIIPVIDKEENDSAVRPVPESVTVPVGGRVDVGFIYYPSGRVVHDINNVRAINTQNYAIFLDPGQSRFVAIAGYSAREPERVELRLTMHDGRRYNVPLEISVAYMANGASLGTTILREAPGAIQQVKILPDPYGAALPRAVYYMGDRNIATVTETGAIQFKNAGRTILTVEIPAINFRESMVICCTTPYADSIELFPASDIIIKQGRRAKVAAYVRPKYVADETVLYHSSNPSNVLMVSPTRGDFIALKDSATITATAVARNRDGERVSASVQVHVTRDS